MYCNSPLLDLLNPLLYGKRHLKVPRYVTLALLQGLFSYNAVHFRSLAMEPSLSSPRIVFNGVKTIIGLAKAQAGTATPSEGTLQAGQETVLHKMDMAFLAWSHNLHTFMTRSCSHHQGHIMMVDSFTDLTSICRWSEMAVSIQKRQKRQVDKVFLHNKDLRENLLHLSWDGFTIMPG